MDSKELFAKITAKATEAENQQTEISKKLEEYQHDKAQAEANKRAALECKDEAAYKKACRELADAESGIEFNTICLQEAKRKPNATEKESEEIMRGLTNAAQEIFVSAILRIEKAMQEVLDAAEPAVKEFQRIDEMARTWKRSVMNDHNERSLIINISQEYMVQTAPYVSMVRPHIFGFKNMHEKNPLFKEGGKK